jgi:hypothetical protein
MLKLASLCFPDTEKSCFYCCPPIRDPEADTLDNIEERRAALRKNRKNLQENISKAREISGESCWGLGFLDDAEKQAGCLLHPLRHNGDDLRHLTGYQFKCANALCREALIFAELNPKEQQFCLNLCREMDSFTYSSRSNPLMRLLAWETGIVQFVIADSRRNDTPFIDRYSFIWQKLDFRLDGYLVYEIFGKAGTDFLRNRLQHFIILRKQLIAELKDLKNDPDFKNLTNTDPVPAHKLDIPLSLSRLLKFGADLWELPAASRELILSKTEQTLEKFLHS